MTTTARARPGRPRVDRAARRAETRRTLLAILERQLRAGERYADISVDRLVAETDFSRTTFYVLFEDKGDLLRGWFADTTDELLAVADGWWSLGPGLGRDDVRAALAAIVGTYRPHVPLMTAMHDAVGADPRARAAVTAAMDRYLAGLQAHLERGQAAGFVDPSLPPRATAFWLQWMAERGFHQAAAVGDPASAAELLDAYTAIVWNTLYAPAAPEQADRGTGLPRSTETENAPA